MNIKKIEIVKLYGYMSKTIKFNDNINLLVGINGSGKTSILNVINWLITPSWVNLSVTEFESLTLYFSFKKEDFTLVCRQTPKEVTIDITNNTNEYNFPQIQADIKISPKKLTLDNELKEKMAAEFGNLEPEPHEKETWKFLSDIIPNPIVIGLDRNLYTEEDGDIGYIEDSHGIVRRNYVGKRKHKINPLDNVIKLAGSEFLRYRDRIMELNKRLNDKIMLSSFADTLTNDTLQEILSAPVITLKQISSLEIKVRAYFAENLGDIRRPKRFQKQQQHEALSKIDQYFNNLKSVLSKSNKEEKEKFNILYITNVNQFRKIRELIKEFEEFENKTKKYYEPIEQYLESINTFLKDSAKELYFDKVSSNLKFRILDKDGNIINENRDIDTLSSGEKQILILFTYIKFNSRLGKLFIIDEPELSLHPKWQEGFLDGIKKIMPEGTQLLFATHSPSIVGKNKKYCKVLLPYQS